MKRTFVMRPQPPISEVATADVQNPVLGGMNPYENWARLQTGKPANHQAPGAPENLLSPFARQPLSGGFFPRENRMDDPGGSP